MKGNSTEQTARRRGIYYKAPKSARTVQSVKICSTLASKIRNRTNTRESPGPTSTLEFIQGKSVNQVRILRTFLYDSYMLGRFCKNYYS